MLLKHLMSRYIVSDNAFYANVPETAHLFDLRPSDLASFLGLVT